MAAPRAGARTDWGLFFGWDRQRRGAPDDVSCDTQAWDEPSAPESVHADVWGRAGPGASARVPGPAGVGIIPGTDRGGPCGDRRGGNDSCGGRLQSAGHRMRIDGVDAGERY